MRILISFVSVLAFIALEMVVFTGGYHYGSLDGYRAGYSKGVFDGTLRCSENQLNFVLDRMAFYESTYKVDARGDFDGTRYLAYGLYQFHHRTFQELARRSGNPKLNWKNPEHQFIVAKWAILHGYGKLWGRTYQHALRDYFEQRSLNANLLL